MTYIKKQNLKVILRIGISILILGFLFAKTDLKNLKNTISNFNPYIYGGAFIILLVHQGLWAYAWKITLEEKNTKLKFSEIFRAVIISHFFGTFLPSSLGPDIILTFNIGRSLPEKQHAPSSLLFIRIINMAGILLASGIALMLLPQFFLIKNILIFTWIFLLGIWIAYWIALHPIVRKIFDKIIQKYPKYFRTIYKIFDSFSTFGMDKKVLIKVWVAGIGMALIKVCIDYTIARSLGIKVPYLWFLALIPAVSIISMIPISIAGLGIREGAYIGFFAIMGVSSSQSISISLTVFTLNLLLCLTGGILYLTHGTFVKLKNT